MAESPAEISALELTDREQFLREVVEPCRPVILRDLVSQWPAVQAGKSSPETFRRYLGLFDVGGKTEAFFGPRSPLAHIPESEHGLLGPLQPDNYRKIRARVMQLLRGG